MGSRDYISVCFSCSCPSSYWEIPHRDVNQNSTGTCLNIFTMTHQQKVCMVQGLNLRVVILELKKKGQKISLTLLYHLILTLQIFSSVLSREPNIFQMFYLLFPPSSQHHFNKGMKYYFYCKRGHIAPGSLQRSWSCAILNLVRRSHCAQTFGPT